ncbi:unnamed protein product [Caenorhabditis auriculariae]|uniref:Uncharacterized protein n=1 Tax=Caenorhabditis auriculariae TaxID=2777116 RepID=A0A8S1GUM6_9PELO|nr:unnamed protein product [Caenorhabditis auriculariae]
MRERLNSASDRYSGYRQGSSRMEEDLAKQRRILEIEAQIQALDAQLAGISQQDNMYARMERAQFEEISRRSRSNRSRSRSPSHSRYYRRSRSPEHHRERAQELYYEESMRYAEMPSMSTEFVRPASPPKLFLNKETFSVDPIPVYPSFSPEQTLDDLDYGNDGTVREFRSESEDSSSSRDRYSDHEERSSRRSDRDREKRKERSSRDYRRRDSRERRRSRGSRDRRDEEERSRKSRDDRRPPKESSYQETHLDYSKRREEEYRRMRDAEEKRKKDERSSSKRKETSSTSRSSRNTGKESKERERDGRGKVEKIDKTKKIFERNQMFLSEISSAMGTNFQIEYHSETSKPGDWCARAALDWLPSSCFNVIVEGIENQEMAERKAVEELMRRVIDLGIVPSDVNLWMYEYEHLPIFLAGILKRLCSEVSKCASSSKNNTERFLKDASEKCAKFWSIEKQTVENFVRFLTPESSTNGRMSSSSRVELASRSVRVMEKPTLEKPSQSKSQGSGQRQQRNNCSNIPSLMQVDCNVAPNYAFPEYYPQLDPQMAFNSYAYMQPTNAFYPPTYATYPDVAPMVSGSSKSSAIPRNVINLTGNLPHQ